LEVEKDIASSALVAIQRVGESYFGPKFPTNATDINFNGYKFKVRIQKCLEVEEKIESLVYGLKGSIDVSAEAVVHGNGLEMRTVELPLEIKSTYRPTHQRQVMAYSLLMADRYDRDIKGALVMGVGKDSTANMLHGVTIDRPGIVDLMRSRNQLASHMASGNHPPPAVGLSECEKCRVRDQCALLYKADQLLSPRPYLPPADDKKLIDSLEARSAALTPAYADFLQRWISLINLEERHALKERRSVWSMPPEERERRGLGFHNLRVKHIGVENQHLYEFKRLQSGSSATAGTPNAPLFDSSIHENDEIVVSSGRHIALGRGRVQKATPRSLVVLLKEKLISPMNTADDPTSQRFYGMHKPDRSFQSPLKPKIKSSYAPIAGSRQAIQDIEDLGSQAVIDRSEVEDQIWCVDKDDSHSTHATARSNVLFMFLYNNSAAARLRRLIVDLEPPKFKKSPTPNTSFASGEVPLQDPLNNTDKASLNEDQKRVINAVLEAQDYALILGMPGTGKTSTVAHLISELTKKRKSILITAFTHSAVDNLLLKIKALGIRFCRLGEGDRVHEEIRPHVYSTKGDGSNHPSQFDVVATTCWGIEKLMLDKRTFDYCLVDEASQLTLPACIGPLRFAERFVLIGDLYQLPPLVRNRDAKSDGLAESLFKKLSEAHPSSVFELRMQYRMNSDIMGLSNRIIYGGKLRCGNEEVKHASLQIPGGLQSIPQPLSRMQQHWISDLLDPTARVRFVDTDDLPAPEDVTGSTDGASDATIRNEVEALVVSLIVKASLECGILPQHIGVIAHLRSQLRAISSRLGAKSTLVEINTVDKYQGRDKELIIVSLVRSNPHGSIGTLMQDFRRLNVALTRSKHKLLIIGSRSTFQSHHLFCELLEYLAQRRWVYRLPKAAHTFYDHKIS
jgi:DNA replication ATP-dependent helicase Dna2